MFGAKRPSQIAGIAKDGNEPHGLLVKPAGYTAGTDAPVGLVSDGDATIVASRSPPDTDAVAVTVIDVASLELDTVSEVAALPVASVVTASWYRMPTRMPAAA